MKKIMFVSGVLVVMVLGGLGYMRFFHQAPEVACPMDSMMCPDGSSVGRTGPSCTFATCPDVPEKKYKDDLIIIDTPELNEVVVSSPLTISGQAKGTYFYEGSFPIMILDEKGQVIGDGVALAEGDWATESFVPFTAAIPFALPRGDAEQKGTIVLQNDNPSGLPENSVRRSIPIIFGVAE